MYLALLKLFGLLLEAVDWIRLRALRYFASPLIQSGSGNVGERAAKLPLSDWRYPITVVFALIEAVVLSVWQVFKWLFFFNTRSLFEFFLSGVKVLIVLSVLSVFGLYGYLAGPPNPDTLRHYKALHQQQTATALLGGGGKLVGAVTNPLAQRSGHRQTGLYAEIVPPVYWDMLDYKTQRELDFNYQKTRFLDVLTWRQKHYKGISLASIFNTINPFAQSSSDSLIKRLATNLHGGESAIADSCFLPWLGLCQTLNSIRFAKHTFPYLANNKGAEFKRWIAMHGNLRGFDNDLAGLRATADVVFDKKPEQLNNAEQALLAIAQLKNEPLLDSPDVGALKDEAILVGRELYALSQPALATNIEQDLLDLNLNKTSSLRSVGDRTVREQSKLSTRGQATLGSFMQMVKQRLAKQYQLAGNQRIISDVQITLPIPENQRFKQDLLGRLDLLQRQCRGCGLSENSTTEGTKSGAAIEVLVADQNAQLVRYFKRGEVKERAIGTLSSVPAAVLLASLGNTPKTRFCNQTYRNLPSSVKDYPAGIINCQTLDETGHSLSFQQAIQIPASLPLFYALRKQSDTEQLKALYQHFSLTDLRSRAGNDTHAEQLAYEMSYGMVQSTPLQQLNVIHQIAEVLYGRIQSKTVVGISQFLVSDLDEDRRYLEFNKSEDSLAISGNYLRTQQARVALRQLLSYDTNRKTGVLKSLSDIKNSKFLLTKTGQSYTKQQIVRDQWLIANVLIRGRRYSVSVFIGRPTADSAASADTLTAERLFKPIMAEIIDSLD